MVDKMKKKIDGKQMLITLNDASDALFTNPLSEMHDIISECAKLGIREVVITFSMKFEPLVDIVASLQLMRQVSLKLYNHVLRVMLRGNVPKNIRDVIYYLHLKDITIID